NASSSGPKINQPRSSTRVIAARSGSRNSDIRRARSLKGMGCMSRSDIPVRLCGSKGVPSKYRSKFPAVRGLRQACRSGTVIAGCIADITGLFGRQRNLGIAAAFSIGRGKSYGGLHVALWSELLACYEIGDEQSQPIASWKLAPQLPFAEQTR